MTDVKRPPQSICVYSSSSDVVDPVYFELATALGAAIGGRGDRLVFGGSSTGMMGVIAWAVKDHGGEVIGVIPEIMRGTPYVFDRADEIVAAKDLRARKAEMEARADTFVALPGGLGTLDELIEILAAKQLHFHRKPVVLLNFKGFYEPLAWPSPSSTGCGASRRSARTWIAGCRALEECRGKGKYQDIIWACCRIG